jgi:hypothetical protein
MKKRPISLYLLCTFTLLAIAGEVAIGVRLFFYSQRPDASENVPGWAFADVTGLLHNFFVSFGGIGAFVWCWPLLLLGVGAFLRTPRACDALGLVATVQGVPQTLLLAADLSSRFRAMLFLHGLFLTAMGVLAFHVGTVLRRQDLGFPVITKSATSDQSPTGDA